MFCGKDLKDEDNKIYYDFFKDIYFDQVMIDCLSNALDMPNINKDCFVHLEIKKTKSLFTETKFIKPIVENFEVFRQLAEEEYS